MTFIRSYDHQPTKSEIQHRPKVDHIEVESRRFGNGRITVKFTQIVNGRPHATWEGTFDASEWDRL